MNHSLSVYTVIYLAILFVTVSVWGGSLSSVSGDGRILLAALGAFSLKLAIDDYIHFQRAKENLQVDLSLSLLIYLLLAASIAGTATQRGRLAAAAFASVFLVGTVWILVTGISGDGGSRRRGWLAVNVVAVVLLACTAYMGPDLAAKYTRASVPLTMLLGLVVFDFFYFGSLKRLAELGAATGLSACDGFTAEHCRRHGKTSPAPAATAPSGEAPKSSADPNAAAVAQTDD